MIPIRLYAYAAAAIALAALLLYARHEHNKVAALEITLSAADAANRANLLTIDDQTKALNSWRALFKTTAQLKSFIDNSNERELELAKERADNRLLRNKDAALPECVALLRASISRTCPSVAIGLRKLAGQDNPGQDPGARDKAAAGRAN